MEPPAPLQHPLIDPDVLAGQEEALKLPLDVVEDRSHLEEGVCLHRCCRHHHVWVSELQEPPDYLEPVPAHHPPKVWRGEHLIGRPIVGQICLFHDTCRG